MNNFVTKSDIKKLLYIKDNSTVQAHVKRYYGAKVSISRIEEIRQSISSKQRRGVEGVADESMRRDRRELKKSSDDLLDALKKAGYEL